MGECGKMNERGSMVGMRMCEQDVYWAIKKMGFLLGLGDG